MSVKETAVFKYENVSSGEITDENLNIECSNEKIDLSGSRSEIDNKSAEADEVKLLFIKYYGKICFETDADVKNYCQRNERKKCEKMKVTRSERRLVIYESVLSISTKDVKVFVASFNIRSCVRELFTMEKLNLSSVDGLSINHYNRSCDPISDSNMLLDNKSLCDPVPNAYVVSDQRVEIDIMFPYFDVTVKREDKLPAGTIDGTNSGALCGVFAVDENSGYAYSKLIAATDYNVIAFISECLSLYSQKNSDVSRNSTVDGSCLLCDGQQHVVECRQQHNASVTPSSLTRN